MSTTRANTALASVAAALLIPRVAKWTGVTLSIDDVLDIMALAAVGWHGFVTFIERYLPPPAPPTSAPHPAEADPPPKAP